LIELPQTFVRDYSIRLDTSYEIVRKELFDLADGIHRNPVEWRRT